jgi:tetratricopeptide (TPR) repeat protein
MEDNIIVKKEKNRLINFSLVSMLVMVFLLPLFFLPVGSFVQFGTSVMFAVVVIISFIFWSVSSLFKNEVTIPVGKFNILALFVSVPLFYTLSFVANGMSRTSFLGYTFDISTVGFIILSFLFLFLIPLIFNTKNRIFYGYVVSILSSIVFALFLIIRLIFGADVLSFGIFTNIIDTVLGNFSNVSIFFAVTSILSIVSFETLNLNRFMKILMVLAFLVSVFFMCLVGFSTIWYIMAIFSIVMFIYRIYVTKTDFNVGFVWTRFFNLPLVLFVLSIIFLFTNIDTAIVNKFNINSIDVRPNLQSTYEIGKVSVKENPFLGSGPNSFVLKWLANKPSSINNTVFWNTDFYYGIGLIPTFMATTGLLGFLSWVLFVIAYLIIGFKNIIIKSGDSFADYLKISSFFVSIFLWVMSFVYIPSVPIFIMTIFFSGLFLAQTVFRSESNKTILLKENPKFGFITSFVLTSVSVVLLIIGYNVVYKNGMAIWYFQKGVTAVNKNLDFDKANMYFDKAIGKVPYDLFYRAKSDLSVTKIQALFNSDVSKMNKDEVAKFFSNELSSAITSALSAKDKNPENYINWFYLGKAYSIAVPKNLKVSGAYESAVSALNESLKRNPNNPAIDLMLARVEIDNGNNTKAKEYIVSAANKKPNYLDAYFLFAQIQLAEGNINEAIKAVSTTVVLEPNNAGLIFQLGVLYYDSGNYTEAKNAFEKSISISPDYANAKYYLGLSLYRLGQKNQALAIFKDIQKVNQENEILNGIINKIESGEPLFDQKTTKNTKNLPIKEN